MPPLQKQRRKTLNSMLDAKGAPGQEPTHPDMLSPTWQADKACCPAAACMQSGMMASRASACRPPAARDKAFEAAQEPQAPVLIGLQQYGRVSASLRIGGLGW